MQRVLCRQAGRQAGRPYRIVTSALDLFQPHAAIAGFASLPMRRLGY